MCGLTSNVLNAGLTDCPGPGFRWRGFPTSSLLVARVVAIEICWIRRTPTSHCSLFKNAYVSMGNKWRLQSMCRHGQPHITSWVTQSWVWPQLGRIRKKGSNPPWLTLAIKGFNLGILTSKWFLSADVSAVHHFHKGMGQMQNRNFTHVGVQQLMGPLNSNKGPKFPSFCAIIQKILTFKSKAAAKLCVLGFSSFSKTPTKLRGGHFVYCMRAIVDGFVPTSGNKKWISTMRRQIYNKKKEKHKQPFYRDALKWKNK